MLLIILYLAFIGLGLPGVLVGAAWPVMQAEFAAPLYMAGVVSAVGSGGTIVSTLMADKLTRIMRPPVTVVAGTFCMVAALAGFALAGGVWQMVLWAVPLGLGSGAVDAVINNYMANNYSSRHMNWLHCFWGAGAMAGPYFVGFFLVRGMAWNWGFGTVAAVLFVILIIVACTMKLWRGSSSAEAAVDSAPRNDGIISRARLPRAKAAMLAFFAYCSLEGTAMLWAATFLVERRGVTEERAAMFASFFLIGLTAGRVLAGFFSNKFGEKKMVYIGLAVILPGLTAVGLPFSPTYLILAGLIVIGMGSGPIFPGMMHATPANFGAEHSQALVGMQMAAAYTGLTVIPPLFGLMAGWWGMGVFPVVLLIFYALTTAAVVAVGIPSSRGT